MARSLFPPLDEHMIRSSRGSFTLSLRTTEEALVSMDDGGASQLLVLVTDTFCAFEIS